MINYSVSGRESGSYLHESCRRYTSKPEVLLEIVDRNSECRSDSQLVKLNPTRLSQLTKEGTNQK